MTFSPHIFFVAILLIVLSVNVLNQSIYGQDAEDNISDDSSNNNDLLVSMKPLENSIGKGDEVNFVITVTDSDSQPIINAKIYGNLIYPDGTHKHTFQGKTDENGKFVFPLSIDKKISLGELKTQIKVTKQDYKPLSLNGVFSVVTAPDSNTNDLSDESDNDDDENIQYSVTGSLEDRGTYNFVIAGDYGCDITTRETVNAMKKKNPDLVLALGDLSDVKDPDCFF